MNLVIFYLILSMVGSFIIGLKQFKIICRVTKSMHLFDSAPSNNNNEAEKRSDDSLSLQILSKLNTILIGQNETINTLADHTKTLADHTKKLDHYEPILAKMGYFYERTRADDIKLERAKYTESLLIPTLSELADVVFPSSFNLSPQHILIRAPALSAAKEHNKRVKILARVAQNILNQGYLYPLVTSLESPAPGRGHKKDYGKLLKLQNALTEYDNISSVEQLDYLVDSALGLWAFTSMLYKNHCKSACHML